MYMFTFTVIYGRNRKSYTSTINNTNLDADGLLDLALEDLILNNRLEISKFLLEQNQKNIFIHGLTTLIEDYTNNNLDNVDNLYNDYSDNWFQNNRHLIINILDNILAMKNDSFSCDVIQK
jgi:hypothetical protein